MSYTNSPLSDYITLCFVDGLVEDNKLIYEIPTSAYMSGSRGDYCLVSIADAALGGETTNDPLVITTTLGTRNSYATSFNLTGILASFVRVTGVSGTSAVSHKFVKNDVKYQTDARPNKIIIAGHTVSATSGFTDNALTQGFITLKFEYLSKPAVDTIQEHTRYIEAFPNV